MLTKSPIDNCLNYCKGSKPRGDPIRMRSSLGLDSRDTTNASAGMAGLVRGTGYRTRNVHPQLTAPETASVATAVGDALQARLIASVTGSITVRSAEPTTKAKPVSTRLRDLGQISIISIAFIFIPCGSALHPFGRFLPFPSFESIESNISCYVLLPISK